MIDRKRNAGFPWQFWVLFLALGTLIFVVQWLFPPRFQISSVQVSPSGKGCLVSFEVTNHENNPVRKELKVSLYADFPGNKASNSRRHLLDSKNLFVSLDPREGRHIESDFPGAVEPLPNSADIAVVSGN